MPTAVRKSTAITIDIDLLLRETHDGYEFIDKLSTVNCQLKTDKITANNPEKATENIRKKALQWGDTPFNPINLELQFDEPRLIPASIIGEMKRDLVAKLTEALVESHRNNRALRANVARDVSITTTDPDEIPSCLMTCHHCIRYANGMCSKETGKKAEPLYLRNGNNTFRLEFDCRNCLMRVFSLATN